MHLAIQWGQLSSFGPAVVTAFYRTLLDSPWGFAFLAERDGRPVGFVSGMVHWRRFYRAFAQQNWLLAAKVLLREIFRIRRWKRLLETSRYAATRALPDAEFLSMVVYPEARGGGVAHAMTRELLAEFKRRGVREVRAMTTPDNVATSRVLERAGFRFLGEAEIHPDEKILRYVITLDESSVGTSGAAMKDSP